MTKSRSASDVDMATVFRKTTIRCDHLLSLQTPHTLAFVATSGYPNNFRGYKCKCGLLLFGRSRVAHCELGRGCLMYVNVLLPTCSIFPFSRITSSAPV